MERVSTYNLQQITLNSALNVQAQLANAQTQEASGLVSSNYGDLGGQQSYELLNLEKELNQAQSWSANATTVGARTQAMYSAIGSMTSVLTKLEASLSSAMSSTDNSSLTSTVQSDLDNLVSAMNSQDGGRYLFSGSNTSTAPVNMSAYTYTGTYDPTVQNFSYYKGDDTDLSVQVDNSTTVTYGVRAGVTSGTASPSDPANSFELAIRACESVLQAGSISTSTLKQAYDLASQALTKMSNLQESVSAISNQLSAVSGTQTNYVTLLQSSIGSIKNIDTATVTTQISQYQTQLQASYLAVASINKINLASYL